MSSRNRNILPNNLAQLQNLIKRDPDSYREEFTQQWRHLESNLEIFKLNPSEPSETIAELVMFISQVGTCYEELFTGFPNELRDLLDQHYAIMNPELRMTMVKSLILLRNKNVVPPIQVLELFFTLLKAKDKLLRKVLYNHIVSDIKNINVKSKNNKVNTSLQNFMFSVLKESSPNAAKMSVDVMIELYRRNIWNDSRTVNVLVTACHSKVTKVMVAALKFFLGSDSETQNDEKDDSDSEDEQEKARQLIVANQVSKKTGKKKKKFEKALAVLRKSKKKSKPVSFNFSAIHLINDPQGFAERLFKQVESSTERFEVKLMIMNLISRLVGIHELILLNFYPYLQRLLQPHQREVTKLLMFAAQSSHEMVPPDAIEPMLMTIANNFVSETKSNEVMAVGLNAIREICNRCPLAMTSDLLQDLVQYKTTKNKTVMMSARSLMQLYRNVDPTLLHKKDRGKPDGKSGHAKEFGALEAHTFIPGTELLESVNSEEKPQKEKAREEGEGSDNDGWETDDEEEEIFEDDDEEWIDVSHSEEDEEMEDGEKETSLCDENAAKKAEEISVSRILTDEDFKRIQKETLVEQVSGKSKGKKRRFEPTSKGKNELVELDQIENVHKKMKHDKESRLATVHAGREGRETFSKPKQKRQNEFASTTNKEKKKNKPFMMMSHSSKTRVKSKKSFREKQIALRDALLKNERGKGRNK